VPVSSESAGRHSEHESVLYEETPEYNRFWPVLLLIGAFVAMSYALYKPDLPSSGSGLPLDKVGHFVMFAAVASLGVLAEIRIRWIIAVLLGQALLSEIVQNNLFTNRTGDWWDLLADCLGIAAGLALGLWASPSIRRRMFRK
jgi:hypothetical protein